MKTYSNKAVADIRKVIGNDPPVDMLDRIVAAFKQTWNTIGGDIWASVRAMAEFDRDARRKLRSWTGRDTYEACVDHVEAYGEDEDAIAAWELWYSESPATSRNTIVKAMKSQGW